MKRGQKAVQLKMQFEPGQSWGAFLKKQRALHARAAKKAGEGGVIEALKETAKRRAKESDKERHARISQQLHELGEAISAGGKRLDDFTAETKSKYAPRIQAELKLGAGEVNQVGIKNRVWQRSRIEFSFVERTFRQVIPIATNTQALIALRASLINGLMTARNEVKIRDVPQNLILLPSIRKPQQRLAFVMQRVEIIDALLKANDFDPLILRRPNRGEFEKVLIKKFGIKFQSIPMEIRESAFNVFQLLKLRARLVTDYRDAMQVVKGRGIRGVSAASGEGKSAAMNDEQSDLNRIIIVDALLKLNGVRSTFLEPLR